jgi:ribosome maturation factor RimP
MAVTLSCVHAPTPAYGVMMARRRPATLDLLGAARCACTARRQQHSEEVPMGKASDRDSLVTLLAPVVSAQGLDLEDVSVSPAGRRRLLRVVVDQDGGVGLDTVAEVSTAVAAVLDASDAMGGTPYVLEVTSPGVDRPLTAPRHWRRNLTRLVRVATAEGTALEGRLLEVDDDGIGVESDGVVTRLGWERVSSGRVQVEFSKPSGGPRAGESDEEG